MDKINYLSTISSSIAKKALSDEFLDEYKAEVIRLTSGIIDHTSWNAMLVANETFRQMSSATGELIKKSVGSIVFRWILTQKLLEWLNNPTKRTFCTVLPSGENIIDMNQELIDYLVSMKVPRIKAENLADKFIKIISNKIKTEANPLIADNINIVNAEDEVTITCTGSKKQKHLEFKLTTYSYNKLKRIHKSDDNDEFKLNLIRLLMRYTTMTKIAPGYSGGCPPALFNYLSQELGVTCELFASPLNFTLDNYCSAYDDTDIPFGSRGNFFENVHQLLKDGGRFEANPPFTEEYLASASEIFLQASTRYQEVPITIFYIHPNWSDMTTFIALEGSPILTKKIHFSKNKHYYKSGLQSHPQHNILVESAADSVLFILQNDMGRKELKITEKIINKINLYFSTIPEDGDN